MFLSVHAATGAIIGTEISAPWLAFIVSFAAHFVMDVIPHGDHEMGKKFFGLVGKKLSEEEEIKKMVAYEVLDLFVVVFFVMYAFKNFYYAKDDSVVWGIIGGILPDVIVFTYFVTKAKWLKWFFNFHKWFHHLIINRLGRDMPLKAGMAMQAALMLICFLLLNEINLNGPLF